MRHRDLGGNRLRTLLQFNGMVWSLNLTPVGLDGTDMDDGHDEEDEDGGDCC